MREKLKALGFESLSFKLRQASGKDWQVTFVKWLDLASNVFVLVLFIGAILAAVVGLLCVLFLPENTVPR